MSEKNNNNTAIVSIKKDLYDTETEDEDEEEIERQLQAQIRLCQQNGNSTDAELFKSRPKLPITPFISFPLERAPKVYLSKFEISGLKSIVQWLSSLSPSKRAIPELVIAPQSLLKDARKLIEDHSNDQHELSVTNKPVLFWLNKKTLNSLSLINGSHNNHQYKITQLCSGSHYKSLKPISSAMKRPKSPLQKLGTSGCCNDSIPQFKISSGTTLKNDLIPSSFEGLIAQTGLKTAPGPFHFRPATSSFFKTTTTTTSSSTVSELSSSTLMDTLTKPISTKPLTISIVSNNTNNINKNVSPLSPLVKPSSPAYPPPPLPPPPSALQQQTNIGFNSPPSFNHNNYSNYYHQNNNKQPQQQPSISSEHAYNQSPSLYYNPNIYHNYAYHPYRPIKPSPYSGHMPIPLSNTSITSSLITTSATTSPQSLLPIRPVPKSLVIDQQQAATISNVQSSPPQVPIVASISKQTIAPGVIVRPLATPLLTPVAVVPATYIQPVITQQMPLGSTVYQGPINYQQQLPTSPQVATVFNYNGPQQLRHHNPMVVTQHPQTQQQSYYQYYQSPQQTNVQTSVQMVQQQQLQPQATSILNTNNQFTTSISPTTIPCKINNNTQSLHVPVSSAPSIAPNTGSQTSQLIYYHNIQPQSPHQSVVTSSSPQSIIVRPQFLNHQAYSAHSSTIQAYHHHTSTVTPPQPQTYAALQTATIVQPSAQPPPSASMYYVSNHHSPSQQQTPTTITQQSLVASNYSNQTYLMTNTTPAPNSLISSNQQSYNMSLYQQQQSQQQPQVATVSAGNNSSSIYTQYPQHSGGNNGAQYLSATTTASIYPIQYG